MDLGPDPVCAHESGYGCDAKMSTPTRTQALIGTTHAHLLACTQTDKRIHFHSLAPTEADNVHAKKGAVGMARAGASADRRAAPRS